jgi:hypothetical protein
MTCRFKIALKNGTGGVMAKFITNAGENLELWVVSPSEVMEQEINARVMPPEMFKRLQKNMQSENRMESVIFGVKKKDSFTVISGHHRLRAAIAAGIKEILFLADTRDLPISKIRAKQIAHNAIDGEDDEETLKRMLEQIDNIDDLLESYVDPELVSIGEPQEINLDDISVEFPWRYISFVFLPHQSERFNELCDMLPDSEDLVGIVSMDVFDEFKDTLLRIGKADNIRSVGAIVSRMVDICHEYLNEKENGEEKDQA